jgi:MFS family permease
VADQIGLSAPFLIVAGLAAALAIALACQPAPAPRSLPTRQHPTSSPRDFARVIHDHPGVLTGAAVLAISGAVGGVTQLLVPLQLHRAGFSASATGLAFSSAAGVYIVVSALVVRLGHRATTVRAATLAALALALSLLPGTLGAGASVEALIGMLLFSTAPRAIVSTVSYPLATESAAATGLGDGLVIGLLNGTWAAGLVLAPLLAGALDQATGPNAAYLVAVIPGALGALWLARLPRLQSRQALQVVQVGAGSNVLS